VNDPSLIPPPGGQATRPTLIDPGAVTDAVRVQMLATEHWGLLATRSMMWNEAFSRAAMFITVLSAAVVALALVAQATAFGPAFRLFALLTLPIVLLVGVATVIRLGDINVDDFHWVLGMNRLRHAYLELAPELEPYFVTSHFDDEASVMTSYGLNTTMRVSRILAGTPTLVGAINVVVVGVLGALIADTAGASSQIDVIAGIAAALVAAFGFALLAYSSIQNARRGYHPRFPRA
jgi:hypothetical protein